MGPVERERCELPCRAELPGELPDDAILNTLILLLCLQGTVCEASLVAVCSVPSGGIKLSASLGCRNGSVLLSVPLAACITSNDAPADLVHAEHPAATALALALLYLLQTSPDDPSKAAMLSSLSDIDDAEFPATSSPAELSELLAPRVNRCPFTELPLRQVTALLCLTLDLTAPATHSGDLRALALLPSTHSLLPSSSSALLLPSNSDGAQSIF